MSKTQNRTKQIVTLGMLTAIAYAIMYFGRIPVVLFLKYDPKDVVINIAGFLFGPLSAFAVSVVVSVVEMFTASTTGYWGCIMNIISTCSFVCTAAVIYKKRRDVKGAIIGLITGLILMTGVMLLWNYLITPIYMGYPRSAVAELLIPAFLPFNLLKGGINATITMLLYKPVVIALRRAGLVPEPENKVTTNKKANIGVILVSVFILITCIVFVLVLRGDI